MPASKLARVRVELKKKSIASTRSRSRGWGMPSARSRFRCAATSRTVSISSLVQSDRLIRSRPRNPVCIGSFLPCYSAAPRTRASSAMRSTTPFAASTQ